MLNTVLDTQPSIDLKGACDPVRPVTYRKASLNIAETFFEEEGPEPPVDILRYFFRPAPVRGSICTKFYTLWLRLEQDPDDLLRNMSRTTRVQIRKAEAEELRFEFALTPEKTWIELFLEFYDSFARARKLKLINRPRVLALFREQRMDLSRISTADGRTLVWHANLRSQRYACCLYSASLFADEDKDAAARIGRANRLLHWSDILRFRTEGFSIYDLGGWYAGKDDPKLLQINDFKERFGGELILQYNSDKPKTRKGALALRLRSVSESIWTPQGDTSRFLVP